MMLALGKLYWPKKAVKYDDVHAKVVMFENKIKSLFSDDEIKVFFNVLDKLYDYTEE